MQSLILNILLWLFSVFISSVSQTLLKISANKSHSDRLHEYLNPYVIIAYGMFFLSTFLTMLAISQLHIHTAVRRADPEGKNQQTASARDRDHTDRHVDFCTGQDIWDLRNSSG